MKTLQNILTALVASTAVMLTASHAKAAAAQTITLKGHHYVMPAGDQVTIRAGKRDDIGRALNKISRAELARVKRLRGAAATADSALQADSGDARAATVKLTCTTNSADVFTPSDINGAASPTNLVVVTNDALGVYRRDGCSTLSRVSLEDFVKTSFNIPSTQEVFDPRVIYDFANQRFMVTIETFDDLNFDQFQYFAVSTDSSGTAWYIYQIPLSLGPHKFCKLLRKGFWDYPMAGQSRTRWFITANDFPGGEPEEGGDRAPVDPMGAILSIDKKPSLSGADVSISCFNNLQFNIAPPIVLDNAKKARFLSTDGFGLGDHLVEYSLDSSGQFAVLDSLTTQQNIAIPSWTAAPYAPQPNGQTLDTLDGRFQSPSIQAGNSLWNVHTVNVNNFARWRLYKFEGSPSGSNVVFSITPTTLATADDDLYNPSMATRSDSPADPAFVTFTRTIRSSTTARGYAAMMVAKGRNASAANWSSVRVSKSLDQYEETGFRGGSTPCNQSSILTCRWGDYSSTQIDPADTTKAWGFNQLIIGRTSKNWTTKGSQIR